MSSGKVKCTCGWSWNKSDSSKKDMYICHECGRDNSNNMKNGGWLDSYADGGTMQEHQENYNNSEVSLPKGFVGMGNNTKGRDYSPAWGGQFQNGGKTKSKYWTEKDIPAANWKKFIKQHPGAIGMDPNRTDKNDQHLPIYADKNTSGYILQSDGSKLYDKSIPAGKFFDPDKYLGDGPIKFQDIPQDRKPVTSVVNNLTLAGLENNPLELGTNLPELRPQVRPVKDWKYIWKHAGSTEWGHVNSAEDMDKWVDWRDWYSTGGGKDKGDSVTITPEYQMGGSVYPVNYVPQAQMGMSIPGATGNMYARHGAPSKGPRRNQTDVTDASAKNGDVIVSDRGQWDYPGEVTEINSTDITMKPDPVTKKKLTRPVIGVSDTGDVKIMKPGKDYKFKGTKVTEYPMAQNGFDAKAFQKVLDEKFKKSKGKKKDINIREVPRGVVNDNISNANQMAIKSDEKFNKGLQFKKEQNAKALKEWNALTKDEQERIIYNEQSKKTGTISEYTPQSTLSKGWDIATNPMTAIGYKVRNEDIPDNFIRGERNNLDMATDVINPVAWANYGGKAISDFSNVPGQLIEGDFEGAGESTLSGTMNALGAIPLAQELKSILPATLKTLPQVKNFREALGTFRGIPAERSLPRLTPEELKIYRQAQDVGRLKATGKPISEQYTYALDQNIPEEHLQKIFGKTKAEIENAVGSGRLEQEARLAENERRRLRLIAENMAEEARLNSMSNSMPESLRERLNAVRARHEATQAASARTNSDRLDDMFAQLDAGTHPSQTAPRVSSTSDQAIDAMNSSRSQDIARAMDRNRIGQMMGRVDDEVLRRSQLPPPPEELIINTRTTRVDPEARNAVTSHSDDYYDFMEPDTSGSLMPYDKEREYLQRYLSGQTNRVEDYANRTLYPKVESAFDTLEEFSGTANRMTRDQVVNLKNKLNQAVSEYPYYEGPVLQNVPLLTLRGSGSLKNVSNVVDKQSFSGIGSGDVFTGSLNTSHSSYLPQLKQVFKYNEGAPQFFGYKPMNDMGFLSDFGYNSDDIAKYLNTEIDDQIRRGMVPNNVLRPYTQKESVLLPHYGIKQFKEGGNIRQEQKGLQNLDNLLNFTNYNKPQPGSWLEKYN
jgi:hypothetical protein